MKLIISLFISLSFCGKVSSQISSSFRWTWINGDNTVNKFGVYGQKGVESATNKPGSRAYTSSWLDASDNLWVFGGNGFASSTTGNLNDLWKYNIVTNQWAWMAGDSVANATSFHGALGDEGLGYTPSAREAASCWVDAGGTNLYLFGGYTPSYGFTYLSDVWSFNTVSNKWRWVKSIIVNSAGYCYGQGNGAAGQFTGGVWPICKAGVTAASSGNVAYLFGGFNSSTRFYDLFQFADKNYPNPPEQNQWAYLKYPNSFNQGGNYSFNSSIAKPGSRYNAMSFLHHNGTNYNYYVFGGTGYGSSATQFGQLSDLWRFDGLDIFTKQPLWTWVKGDSSINSRGSYGTVGVSNSGNMPPAREYGSIAPSGNGNYILFGGGGAGGYLFNDLWNYDVLSNKWTWISGSNLYSSGIYFSNGNYGIKGVQSPNNMIGSRSGHAYWVTKNGEIYIFGGGTAYGKSNDLWKFSGPVGIWLGSVSSAWENPANWSSGVIPNYNIDVVINSGSIFINSNVTVRSLKLNTGVSLMVNSNYKLNVLK